MAGRTNNFKGNALLTLKNQWYSSQLKRLHTRSLVRVVRYWLPNLAP